MPTCCKGDLRALIFLNLPFQLKKETKSQLLQRVVRQQKVSQVQRRRDHEEGPDGCRRRRRGRRSRQDPSLPLRSCP
jgi:hypothetical protein